MSEIEQVKENAEAVETAKVEEAGAQYVTESVSTSLDSHKEELTWLLVGSGIVAALILLIRRHQRFIDWLIPLGLIGGGVFFIQKEGRVMLRKRDDRIHIAEQNILAELDPLDPIAKAQVLKSVAESELPDALK